MTRIPIRRRRLGKRGVPTVEMWVSHRMGGRLDDEALVDTGSAFLLFSEALLRANGFPTRRAERVTRGIEGISGRTELWRLDDCQVHLVDDSGAPHGINGPVFFTRNRHPPIIGRETLRAFGAHLKLDCTTFEGSLDIG